MIVALYARVSTVKQAEKDLSIPDQIGQMREWCERHGHSVATVYTEAGASATDDRRPIFQQMISEACVSPPPFDAVMVHSLSRFFRDSFGFALYERKLKKIGVKLISITQQTSEDPSGMIARKFFNIMDEYQSLENAKHTLRAMQENARRGFFNGSTPPFGYKTEEVEVHGNKGKKKRLVIDTAEAGVVKKLFALYVNGHNGQYLGMSGIASLLNRQGITFRGRQWSNGRVNALLANPVYMGDYYFNKKNAKTRQRKPQVEWVFVKVPPIIDERAYIKAQKRRESRHPAIVNPKVVSSPTLLTGLLKCGICGAGMTLATGKGGRYRYYKCSTRIKKGVGCHSGNVRMETIDRLVLHSLSDKVFTLSRVKLMLDELKKRQRSSRSSQTEHLERLGRELANIQKSTDRLFEAVEKGVLPLDNSLSERSHKIQSRRQAVLAEIAGIKREKEIPQQLLSSSNLQTFCQALKARLLDGKSGFGKGYLKLLVDEIRLEGKEVRMRGSYASIVQAVALKDLGTPEGVPRSMHAWLPGQDSNLQPSG